MKKILIPVLFLSFVIGIYATARAEMTYGPLVVEDAASLLSQKTFEIMGFYYTASPTLAIETPKDPGGNNLSNEIDLPWSKFDGAISYGLTDIWELGVSVGNISATDIVSISSTTLKETTRDISGASDLSLRVKARTKSGKVAGSIAFVLPTGEEDIYGADNDMDIALKFIWSPLVDDTGGIHMNLGYTSWGDKDALGKNNKEQTSSIDYGIGLEFFLGGYNNKKSFTLTAEFTGNTLENRDGDKAMDVYSGIRIDVAKDVQISGLLGIGVSDGSAMGKWELGYGLGLKWVGNIF